MDNKGHEIKYEETDKYKPALSVFYSKLGN